MSAPGAGGPSPGRVRREVESLLLRVVSAGRVAEVLWRLMHTEQQLRRRHPARPGGEQDDTLMRLARQNARVAIEATVHGDRPQVYHAAVGAACRGGEPNLVAHALAELACLHLRVGSPDDSLRLREAARASQRLTDRTSRVLAETRASLAGPAAHPSTAGDVQAGHDNDREQPGWQ